MSEELPPRLAGQAASVVWAEARAPLLAEIERLKTCLFQAQEAAKYQCAKADAALREREVVSKIGWYGDRSGTPFGPSDAGPEDEHEAEPERKCGTCEHWQKEEFDYTNYGVCEQPNVIAEIGGPASLLCKPIFGCIHWTERREEA